MSWYLTKMCVALVCAAGEASLCAAGLIQANVSIKVILNPADGMRYANFPDQLVQDAMTACNQRLAEYWRGYRYNITEITNVGGLNDYTGPSKWFSSSASWQDLRDFETEARTNSAYRWRTNAANVYVRYAWFGANYLSCAAGGNVSVPSLDASCGYSNVCWINISPEGWAFNHEIGHHFDLLHTFHYGSPPCGGTVISGDLVSDTLTDGADWTRDQVAINTYGLPYALLDSTGQTTVDNTYYNVMSYHECTNRETLEIRMTEGQLDRWADTANRLRRREVTGRTLFVSLAGNDVNSGEVSSQPKRTVLNAVNASAPGGGDIVLLRPGNYNEQVTLNRAVTVRTTRAGQAVIGRR